MAMLNNQRVSDICFVYLPPFEWPPWRPQQCGPAPQTPETPEATEHSAWPERNIGCASPLHTSTVDSDMNVIDH